jgi:hypothetical protein
MDQVILEVARATRPYLAGLVGPRAPEFDRRVAELLGQARGGTDVGDEILALLATTPATHAWAATMLEDDRQRPPELQPSHERTTDKGGYAPLDNPNGGDPVDAERYECPRDGAYVWWRSSVSRPVRDCPDHPGTILVLREAG